MKKGCFYCRQFWSIGNSGSLTWRSIWSPIWRPQLSSFVEGIICSYHKHQIVAAGKAGLCKSSSAGRCASFTCLYWKYQVKNLIETFWWLFQCCIGNAYRMLVIPVVTFLTPLSSNSEIKRIDRPTFLLLAPYWRERSSQLFPFWSTWGFRPHWAGLRTPALSFDRCTAPGKTPRKRTLLGAESRGAGPLRLIRERSAKGRWPRGGRSFRRTIPLTAEPISLFYARNAPLQKETRVKLNRVFFPRWSSQVRSLGCGFAR